MCRLNRIAETIEQQGQLDGISPSHHFDGRCIRRMQKAAKLAEEMI